MTQLLKYTEIENMDISDIQVENLKYENPEKFTFFKKEDEKNPMFFGIEFEYNYLDKTDDFRKRLKKYQEENNINFFHCKSDSSLYQGVEIVTHPFTRKWFYSNIIHFRNLLTIAYKSGGKISSNTGLHIHISKQGITNQTKAKLFHFINKYNNTSFMRFIGGRNSSSGFSFYDGETLLSKEGMEVYEKEKARRQEALNFTGDDTLEIRFMMSTTKTLYLLARMQFIFSSLDFIRKNKVLDCTYDNYIKYIETKEKSFKELKEYLRDMDL